MPTLALPDSPNTWLISPLTFLTGSLFFWLSRTVTVNQFCTVFAWILKLILANISWQELLPSGVAAMELAISQLVL